MKLNFKLRPNSDEIKNFAIFKPEYKSRVFPTAFVPIKGACFSCGKEGDAKLRKNSHFPEERSAYFYSCDGKCKENIKEMIIPSFEYTEAVYIDSSIHNRTVNVKRTSGEIHKAKVAFIVWSGMHGWIINLFWYADSTRNSDEDTNFDITKMTCYNTQSRGVSLEDFSLQNPDIKEIDVFYTFKSDNITK